MKTQNNLLSFEAAQQVEQFFYVIVVANGPSHDVTQPIGWTSDVKHAYREQDYNTICVCRGFLKSDGKHE